jgi:NTP pyrophosphatase (non-canonical NTP hydrolase)
MRAADYQKMAARTLIDAPPDTLTERDHMILWNALGAAGEAGEICELVKKGLLHQHGLDHNKLHKEIGDCLWYLTALCTKLDFDLGEVMAANIEKLRQRYPDGFRSEDSRARVDTHES